jgi:Ca2+-binding RTX toxin-like protein
MTGGLGDDTYTVDNIGDKVIENLGGGSDTILSKLAIYSLATNANIENLAYVDASGGQPGSGKFIGTGNALANELTGGSNNDILNGLGGDDSLNGGAGNDTLSGGEGSDTALFGGTRDQYVVSRLGAAYLVTGRDGSDLLNSVELLRFGSDDALTLQQALAGNPAVAPSAQDPVLPDYALPALMYSSTDRWNSGNPVGSPVSLTFSFMTAIPAYYSPGEHPTFIPLSLAQRDAARQVLAMYASITNVSFTEVSDVGAGGQLRFGTDKQSGTAGYAYTPSLSDPRGGDVWLANNQTTNSTFAAGSFGLATMIHEVGHSLGLKHPGNYSGNEDPPFLPASDDNSRYTVMSYNSRADGKIITVTGTEFSYSWVLDDQSVETPQLYDIAAIQYLYGVNASQRAGDDTYTFASDRPFFATLWDGGGKDTIDCSNFTLTCVIDLRPGSFSSLGLVGSPLDLLPSWFSSVQQPTYNGGNNLSLAYSSQIENAVGGSANDTLTGNSLSNVLDGGAGNDLLTGGAGADFFDFASLLNAASNVDTVSDFVSGADHLQLDHTFFSGLAGGVLGSDSFVSGAGQTQGSDAGDRIIFDLNTGALYFDADGAGGAASVKFAVLGSGAAVAASDFIIL